MEDSEIKFKIIKEIEFLENWIVWNVSNHLDVECLVCKTKYVFDKDPIYQCMIKRNNNLMFILEFEKDSDITRRIFYNSYKIKTRRQLIKKK